MDNTQVAAEIFNKYAKEYQNRFMDVSLYYDSFDLFCNSIHKPQAHILELACGPGNITQYLLKKRPDFKILGTDLAPNMLELAKINNPTTTFQLMDSRAIITLNTTYDGLMCGFCLPYLTKEEAIKLIADSAKVLNPGGVMYISTMEDDHHKSGFKTGSKGDMMFMNYHEAGYLTEALTQNGYKIIDLNRKYYLESDNTQTVDLLIVARK